MPLYLFSVLLLVVCSSVSADRLSSYIIRLTQDVNRTEVLMNTQATLSQISVSARDGSTLTSTLVTPRVIKIGSYAALIGSLTTAAVPVVAGLQGVALVVADAYINQTVLGVDDSTIATDPRSAVLEWNVERVFQGINPDYTLPISQPSTDEEQGKGKYVVVIDSGVGAREDPNNGVANSIPEPHPEYEGGIIRSFNAYPNEGWKDLVGHGSHVAGIIASKSFGVAKKATIIDMKVFNGQAQARQVDIIQALAEAVNWCKVIGTNKVVINMSIGLNLPADSDIALAINGVVESGCHIVAAAGNNFADACQHPPGSVNGVIVVAATSKDDQLYEKSNIGPCVSLLAPGKDIRSLDYRNKPKVASGTSMAAPLVSGIAIRYLSNPQYKGTTAQHLMYALTSQATPNAIPLDPSLNTTNRLLNGKFDSRKSPLLKCKGLRKKARYTADPLSI